MPESVDGEDLVEDPWHNMEHSINLQFLTQELEITYCGKDVNVFWLTKRKPSTHTAWIHSPLNSASAQITCSGGSLYLFMHSENLSNGIVSRIGAALESSGSRVTS